jgi:hypothetical protein
MAQIYLLSVLSLIAAGFMLSADFLAQKISVPSGLLAAAGGRVGKLVCGGAAALIGILKLFIVAPGETVPFAGDLLPAAMGITLGAILLYDAWKYRSLPGEGGTDDGAPAAFTYRVSLGLAGMLLGALHFIFPAAPIL